MEDWGSGSTVVFAGITGTFKIVFGAVFGVIYAPLVITGLHHMSNAIDLQLISDYEGTMLWPMIALSNIAQGSAVLGMVWLQRKDKEAQEVNIPGQTHECLFSLLCFIIKSYRLNICSKYFLAFMLIQ